MWRAYSRLLHGIMNAVAFAHRDWKRVDCGFTRCYHVEGKKRSSSNDSTRRRMILIFCNNKRKPEFSFLVRGHSFCNVPSRPGEVTHGPFGRTVSVSRSIVSSQIDTFPLTQTVEWKFSISSDPKCNISKQDKSRLVDLLSPLSSCLSCSS